MGHVTSVDVLRSQSGPDPYLTCDPGDSGEGRCDTLGIVEPAEVWEQLKISQELHTYPNMTRLQQQNSLRKLPNKELAAPTADAVFPAFPAFPGFCHSA